MITGDRAITWLGDRAVRIEVPGELTRTVARRLATALVGASVRAGMDCVVVESREPDPQLMALVADIVGSGDSGPADLIDAPPALVVIHAAYDGDDLAHVADVLGCSVDGLANAHQAQRWRVAMMGFAPGFGYLVPEGPMTLPWSELPRRATPRSRVPAGSIAVAGGMSAVYPAPLPGGWHLIGTTVQRMFDLDRRTPPGTGLDPSLLHTGDEVAFRQVPA